MMYRTEAFGGSGERDAVAVMCFEMAQLGNTDILEHLLSKGILSKDTSETAAKLLKELDAFFWPDSLPDDEEVDDFSKEEVEEVCEMILRDIFAKTGKNIRYAIWLADKANAYRYWCSCEDIRQMNSYFKDEEVPSDFPYAYGVDTYDEKDGFILSDLGEDGALYGFEECPIPVQE